MPSDFLLVRHGQTDWNLNRRIQGSVDIPLNSLGYAQAAATASAFASRPFDLIATSHLDRAIVTGKQIGLTWQREVAIDARLTERGHGRYEGWSWPEVVAHVGEEHADEFFQHSPELEAWDNVKSRMIDALTGIAHDMGSGVAVVVSHGGSIRALISAIQGVHHRSLSSLNNCSITHVRFDGEWSVLDYNNVEHLPADLRS